MFLNGRNMPGERSAAAISRCGLWPTVMTVLLATAQDSAPTTPPAAPAPTTAIPAKEAPAATKEAVNPAVPQPVAAPAAPVKTAPASSPATASVGSSSAKPNDDPATKTIPWEYAPYKIHVWLAAVPSSELGEEMLSELRQDLTRRAEVVVGAPWSVTVAAPPASLYYTVALCPQLLTDTTIGATEKDRLKDDKIIVVSLSASPRAWNVWAREFDCHARIWGPQATRTERQPAGLSSTVFDAVIAAFGPLVRVEDGHGKVCVVRGRATGLITTPDSPAQIVKGDVLQPTFRQNDRLGNPLPGKIEPIPFTFLQVTSNDPESPSLLICNVHSGMRNPVQGRITSNSRRERWAIKVRPRLPETTLFVESQPVKPKDPKLPQSGVEVFSKTPQPEPEKVLTEEETKIAEKKNPPESLGVTDWRGSVSVSQGGPTLRVLYLKNGGQLLARLPIVPGLDERLVAEVPDDNPRLQAEGFVRGLNSEVTDLVVQRQLIKVRMKKKIGEGKLDEAEKLFEEFRGLKTLNDLQSMLNMQIQRIRKTNSSAVKQKIDKLFGDERELLGKYIDAELQVKLLSELSQARANPTPPENADGPKAPRTSGAAKTEADNKQTPADAAKTQEGTTAPATK